MVVDTHIMEFIDLFHCIQFMIFQNLFFSFRYLCQVAVGMGTWNMVRSVCVCACVCVTETQCKNDLLLGYT
jgi:hypothetical protein